MENEFVDLNNAIQLKKLSFDEPCFGYFHGNRVMYGIDDRSESGIIFMSNSSLIIAAPLWQQAFDWLRIKHGLICWIRTTTIEGIKHYHGEVVNENISEVGLPYCQKFQVLDIKSYVEARRILLESAILIIK